MFCCAVLCVISSFATILMGKRELVGLPFFSWCLVTVIVLWLFLMVPSVGLQCLIVVFPVYYTHIVFSVDPVDVPSFLRVIF